MLQYEFAPKAQKTKDKGVVQAIGLHQIFKEYIKLVMDIHLKIQ